jgi:D-aspartate ligase
MSSGLTADEIAAALDRTAPVLVLRRSRWPFQHGVLAAARSLGRADVPVYAQQSINQEPAACSRYLRRQPPPQDGRLDDDWALALMRLPDALDGALLVAVDDRAAIALADHQDELRKRFRLARQPSGLQRRLASKRELWRLCSELGVPTPRCTFPRSQAELLALAREHGYPVVVKRAEPWLPAADPTAPSVAIAHNPYELQRAWARMESPIAPQVMLQDHIPGEPDSVWMFNGYFAADGRCLCAFTGRKLRQCGDGTGPTSLGLAAWNPDVAAAAKRLMGALGYRGIVDMGFRFDCRDGTYRLLDVNPRLGSTFRLFTAANGLDVLRAQHLDLTGRHVPATAHPDGRTWIDERGDLAAAGRLLRQGRLRAADWLESLRGVDECAWWAADDPLPFAAMAARLGVHTVGRLVAARRRSRR